MRLWLLDADVIIKFLKIDVFDKLAGLHEIHVASSVIDEVKYYRKNGKKIPVNFRQLIPDRTFPGIQEPTRHHFRRCDES